MKKKLALLLAVVMLVGIALPTNVAAYSNNFLRGGSTMKYYDEGSVMVDARHGQTAFNMTGNSGTLSLAAYNALYSALYSKFYVEALDLLAHDGWGLDLILQVTDATAAAETISKGQSFYEIELKLNNATWAFVNTGASDSILTNNGATTGINNTYGRYLKPANVTEQTTGFTWTDSSATGYIYDLVTTGTLTETEGTAGTGGDMLASDYEGTLPHPQTVVENAVIEGLKAVNAQLLTLDTWAELSDNTIASLISYFTTAALTSINNEWKLSLRGVSSNQHAAEVAALYSVAEDVYAVIFDEMLPSTAVANTKYDSTATFVNAFNLTEPKPNNLAINTLAGFANAVKDYPTTPLQVLDQFTTANPLKITSDLLIAYNGAKTALTLPDFITATGGIGTMLANGWVDNAAGSTYNLYSYNTPGTYGFVLSEVGQYDAPVLVNTGVMTGDLALIVAAVDAANAYQASANILSGANYNNMINFFSTTNANGMTLDFDGWTAAEKNSVIINPQAEANPYLYKWGLYWLRTQQSIDGNELFWTTATGGTTGSVLDDGTYANEVTTYARSLTDAGTGKSIPYWIHVYSQDPTVARIRVAKENLVNIVKNDVLLIPLVIMTLDPEEPVSVQVVDYSNLFRGGTYTLGTTGVSLGTTNSQFKTVVNAAKGRVYLGVLRIDEVSPNTLKNGSFVLIPPTGYNMVDNSISGSFSYVFGTGASVARERYVNITQNSETRAAMVLTFSGLPSGRLSAGYVEISNLSMTPLNNNPELISDYGSTLNIMIRDANAGSNWGGATSSNNFIGWIYNNSVTISDSDRAAINALSNANIYPKTMEAAKREYWNIDYYGADPVTVFSGRLDQATAKVTVKELVLDSWATEKDTYFTVCDADGNELSDVKITRVGIKQNNLRALGGETRGFANLLTDSSMTFKRNYDINGAKIAAQYKWLNCAFSVSGSQFIVSDLYKNTNTSFRTLELTFYLSAQANFEGDVYIKMSGTSIADNIYSEVSNNAIVQVASFVPPVTITTQPSEVQLGYQTYKTADITITENMINGVGSIVNGNKLQLALGEYGQGRLTQYMYFAPMSKANITLGSDPNFNISEVIQTNLAYNTGWSQKVIEFTVLRKSSSIGGEINITNVNLNIDRTPPQGSYDLLVGGTAIVDNNLQPSDQYMFLYDRFDVWGVVEPGYIVMKTEGSNVPVKNKVELTAGTNIIRVNGVETEIEVPVMLVDDRMYVPLRFASVALGIADEKISFDEGSRKAIIVTAEKTIAFKQNSSMYEINGIELSMFENGVEAIAFIENDRMYIPVRFLAYALEVPVDYDIETNVAILNGDK